MGVGVGRRAVIKSRASEARPLNNKLLRSIEASSGVCHTEGEGVEWLSRSSLTLELIMTTDHKSQRGGVLPTVCLYTSLSADCLYGSEPFKMGKVK